jgi:uncharacterized cupredoxin-like copper-binding protein
MVDIVGGVISGINGTLEAGASQLDRAISAAQQQVNGLNQVVQTLQQSVDFAAPLGNPPEAPENLNDAGGRRVRLRAKPGAVGTVYGNGIMSPLLQTNGMVFPYQPEITYQQEVTYTPMELVHTNQDFMAYSRTPALKLGVSGEFTVQNQNEGRYALACVHFLRTCTKMWFGGSTPESVQAQGTPPPVLLFDAYGQYMFNSLPVIITQFAVTLPKDVDYVPVRLDGATGGPPAAPSANSSFATISNINDDNVSLRANNTGYAWMPALFTIQVQLTVQNTPRRLRSFDLADFRSGQLLRQGGWV